MLRRFLLVLSLALLFGLGQQGAAVHALSHFADVQGETQQDKSAPHAGFCDQCLAYAALDAADSPQTFAFGLPTASASPLAHGFHSRSRLHVAYYASRAPPLFA